VLQESLPPTERAVYVLREAFDYPFREIARILGLEEAHARQLATRARQRIADGRRASMSAGDQGRLLDAFMVASRRGDLTALEVALVSDIASCMGQRRSCGRARLPRHER
jgi:RNA polymerase sigma-70 factor (ECF subfamily)